MTSTADQQPILDGVYRTPEEVLAAVWAHDGYNDVIHHVAGTPIRSHRWDPQVIAVFAKRGRIDQWKWDEKIPDPISKDPSRKHFGDPKDLRAAAFLAKHNLAMAERLYGPISKWTFGADIKSFRFLFADASESFNPDLGDWDVSNIADLQGAFKNCAGFKGTNLHKWKTTSLEQAGLAFENCAAFEADLSSWDVSKLKNAAMMFRGCLRFNASLAQWQTGSLQAAAGMFEDCWSLEALDVSEWKVDGLKTASGMFCNAKRFCSDVSGWRLQSVVEMRKIFAGCEEFDGDLGSWRCPASAYRKNPQFDARYRKHPDQKGSALEDIHPEFLINTELMHDAFRGATKFSWRIAPWMIDLLSQRERSELATLEASGKAGYLVREAKASRRWVSLGIRLRVHANNKERLCEEAAAEAPPPSEPLPRSELEAQQYKKEFTSEKQAAEGTAAGRRRDASKDGGSAHPGLWGWRKTPKDAGVEIRRWEDELPTTDQLRRAYGLAGPAELTLSARLKRPRDERNRQDYEAEYGEGSWAKLPVCEQDAAAERARELKKARGSA